jgi:hypothetical protein
LNYVLRKNDSRVELWIGVGSGQAAKNKAAFQALEAQKNEIEADFEAPLDWQELPDAEGCRICHVIEGGYRSPSDHWPTIQANLVDAMVRLDKAVRARVVGLKL